MIYLFFQLKQFIDKNNKLIILKKKVNLLSFSVVCDSCHHQKSVTDKDCEMRLMDLEKDSKWTLSLTSYFYGEEVLRIVQDVNVYLRCQSLS